MLSLQHLQLTDFLSEFCAEKLLAEHLLHNGEKAA